jgi:hypothetical protein
MDYLIHGGGGGTLILLAEAFLSAGTTESITLVTVAGILTACLKFATRPTNESGVAFFSIPGDIS